MENNFIAEKKKKLAKSDKQNCSYLAVDML